MMRLRELGGKFQVESHPEVIAGPNGATIRKLILSLFLLASSTTIVSAQQYDLVLEGGRVMDPETGVDAVRNVGIRDGKIVRVSSEALQPLVTATLTAT